MPLPPPGANFQKMRRPRPRPCTVGGGSKRRRSRRARAGGSASYSRPGRRRRRLLAGAHPSSRPPARPCSGDAREPEPGAGPRPAAALTSALPERAAAADLALEAAMGNTVHRTLPGTAGSPARIDSSSPPGDQGWLSTPQGALDASGAGACGAAKTRLRARPVAGLCAPAGRQRVPVTLGTPGPLLLPLVNRAQGQRGIG